ncbi:MAG TPA: TetR family transcriptional regulator [Bdellovibrio sp.]|nr:TetR family transcriptional regulator [Bdellovibrio sp.]
MAKKTVKKKVSRKAGRPRGSEDTRNKILLCARGAFSESGYEGVSLRSVAVKAGVDPSTVIHYFGTKEGLYEAVIKDVASLGASFQAALKLGVRGYDLVLSYLKIWDDKNAGPVLQAILRTSLGSNKATPILRKIVLGNIFELLPKADPIGAELAMTHLLGVILGRHIARLPELSETNIETIALKVGPVLDEYI